MPRSWLVANCPHVVRGFVVCTPRRLPGVIGLLGDGTWRMTGVGGQQGARDRAFVAAALLGLFPAVSEDSDRPGEHEESASKWRRKSQFGVDHRGGSVDVHRYRFGSARCQ